MLNLNPMPTPEEARAELERRKASKQQALQEMLKRQPQSAAESALTAFNVQGGKLARGILRPVFESGLLGERIKKGSEQYAKKQHTKLALAEEANPISAAIGGLGGSIIGQAPLFAIPGVGAAGTLARTATQAGAQAGTAGLLEEPEKGQSRLSNALISALTGTAAGGIVHEGGKILKGILSPFRKNADTAYLEQIPDITKASERAEAAKRLGTSLTPAEASGNPLMAQEEGRMFRAPDKAKQMYSMKFEREQEQQAAIHDLYKNIFDEKDLEKPATKQLYAEAYKSNVPEEFVEQMKQNEIYKDAINKVENNPAFREAIKNIPKNNFAYLDLVKRALDDMAEGAPRSEARLIKQANTALKYHMDTINPKYADARAIAEREIVLGKIQEKMAASKETGTAFFNKVLKNKTKFDELQHSLRNVPEAQQALKDMRTAWENLIDTESVKSAARSGKKGDSLNIKEIVFNKLRDVLGNKADEKIAALITDPNWHKKLNMVANLKDKKKSGEVFNALIKALGAQTTTEIAKPLELQLTQFAGFE